jgi:hypothetical protein
MSLPQHVWDVIRKDPRFLAATRDAQKMFIRCARTNTLNKGQAVSKAIFLAALTEAFGPPITTKEAQPNDNYPHAKAHLP